MHHRRRHRRTLLQSLEPRCLLSVGDPYVAPASPRESIDLAADWRFLRSDVANAQSPSFNDSAWTGLSLPHTWNNLDGQDGGGNYYRGVGWYRKTITVPASMRDAGESLILQFEGSSVATTVYLDGTLIGSHTGAFSAFNFDVTTSLSNAGTHTLAVKVDNTASLNQVAGPQSGDFTTFGGIYRDVSLLAVAPARVAVDDFASAGVYYSASNVSAASANVSVRTNVHNVGAAKSLLVHSVLVDVSGKIVSESMTTQSFGANAHANVTQASVVANPHLWNGRSDPYLHDLYVEVRDPPTNALLDLVHQRVGIRSYSISATQGFLLNGQPYQLRGASIHQDRLDKGWAISDDDVEEDIDLLLEMGGTAIRTAHYEQCKRLYEYADETGVLIYTEVPNVGSGNSGVIPATQAFADSMQQQLKETIRQNYNHASVVVWGVYNEVSNNTANTNFVTTLHNLVKAEDPTRLSVGASWNGSIGNLERATDVVAFNRYYGWYYGTPSGLATQLDAMHAAAPTVAIGMSEFGAGGALTHHQQNPPLPPTAGPWHPEEYQSIYHEQTYRILAARPWVWSVFVWNMFDFAVDGRAEGDTVGRNDKGLVSYDRQTKKDAFFLYKANWSADPTLHITSRRWVERSNASTELKVYANVQNLRASVNGIDIGALTDTGASVWLIPAITLAPGDNTVVVTGTRNGQTYTDTVVWRLTPPPSSMADANIRINFQPTTGATPAGYAVDSGLTFGTRANGAQYGWSGDNSANTRRRNLNSDTRYDTLIHLQYNGSRFTWEHAVPNGVYDVFLAAGDAQYTDALERFSVEGVTAVDGDGQDNFDTFLVRVLVTDGRLTVAPDGINTKLNFIEIKTVDTVAPTATSSSFARETGHAVSVVFSEAMNATSFDPADLTVAPAGGGASVAATGVSYDATTRTATFTFATPLGDGRWVPTLAAGSVKDAAGYPLGATYTGASFGVLAGDADDSGSVDFSDLLIVAQNYGATGKTFSAGNFDYSADGLVGFEDLLIVAQRYGRSLATVDATFKSSKPTLRRSPAADIL